MSRAGAITPGEVPRFDVVQAITPVGTAPCAECTARIVDTYFEWDGRVICATCQSRIAAMMASPSRGGLALGLGLAAAVTGAALYFVLSAVTGRDLAIAMVFVGFAIGKAVRVGSGGRGGRRYQWLAASLTYAAIASTYVPFVTSGFGDRAPATVAATVVGPSVETAPSGVGRTAVSTPSSALPTRATPAHIAALLLLATAAPLLAGLSNLPGIAITIVAVLVAWRINRPLSGAFAGPFAVPSARHAAG